MRRLHLPTILFWIIAIAALVAVVMLLAPWIAGPPGAPPELSCRMNIRQVQQAVRKHQQEHDLPVGAELSLETLIEAGRLPYAFECPGAGSYSISGSVPERGNLYMRCSDPEHMDFEHGHW
jgi:hypothetical protein